MKIDMVANNTAARPDGTPALPTFISDERHGEVAERHEREEPPWPRG